MTPITRRVVIILAAVAVLALPDIVVTVMMPAPAAPAGTLPFAPAQDTLQGQAGDEGIWMGGAPTVTGVDAVSSVPGDRGQVRDHGSQPAPPWGLMTRSCPPALRRRRS